MTKLVGILNITPDSFSDGGKFDSLEAALTHLKQLLQDGVDIIDIGAESTRPGATALNDDEEWQRLEAILPEIVKEVKKFNDENNKNIQTAIDSYHFSTIKKAYELGVDIINDVSGLVDEKIVDFIVQNNVTTILMHSLSVPTNPKLIVNPHLNVNEEIIKWAQEKIALLSGKGVKKSQLIFDPGIGFAKNSQQSIRILKGIDAYFALDLPIYIGHSRKRFLDEIDWSDFDEKDQTSLSRDEKTIIISQYLQKKSVDFIRVHDVANHRKML